MKKRCFLWGTLVLTITGFLSKIIGFFYRIFLSHTIGAEGMGVFQLIFPVQAFAIALACSGIQTAISRLVAAKIALKDKKTANDIFLLACGLAFIIACLCSMLIRHYSVFLSTWLLAQPETAPLLCLMSYMLPFCAFHGCVNSYYYAQKKTELPSAILLIEQTVRVFSAYLVFQIFLSRGMEPDPVIAITGILCGELAAALCSAITILWNLQKEKYRFRNMLTPGAHLSEIIRLAIPVSANRLLLTLLSSVEVILIPRQLMLFGLSSSDALSIYGVFTGMALPFILFPCAITNSVSVMLLPSVAQMQALRQTEQLRRNTGKIFKACILLGSICSVFFFLFGPFLGTFVFHNATAGVFLRTLSFICIFLYLNTTMASVLNGLGKTGYCLVHNVIGISIRISSVLFIIPVAGMKAYLWGILISELVVCCLHSFTLLRLQKQGF